jgi:hypothetical protein
MLGSIVVLSVLLVLVFYRHRRVQQAAALAARFQGRVSPMGDAVRFEQGGASWQVRRLASQGGLAGTGWYACLELALEAGPGLVLGPAEAMKYVYALSVPREHSSVRSPSAVFVAVGPAHRRVAAALGDADAGALLARLFVRPYSTLQVSRETHLAWSSLPRRRWVLRLTGLPHNLYTEPDILQPFLDNIILLCGRIELCIDRRVGFV